jgi:hypothetical protein
MNRSLAFVLPALLGVIAGFSHGIVLKSFETPLSLDSSHILPVVDNTVLGE